MACLKMAASAIEDLESGRQLVAKISRGVAMKMARNVAQ